MHKAILRRSAAESFFLAVVEGIGVGPGVTRLAELGVTAGGPARAVEVTCGGFTDIVVISDDGEGPVTSPARPELRFQGGVGVVSFRSGRMERLWMLGGTQLAYGEARIVGEAVHSSEVVAVDPQAGTVAVEAGLPQRDWRGGDLIVAGHDDGVYPIDRITGTTVYLGGEPIIDIDPGDEFTIVTSAERVLENG